MKPRKHKRVVGRVIPYDREKLKAVMESLGMTLSDENIEPYQPWEERILGVINGLLQEHAASEEEVLLQAVGQYKVFCYWLENKLPELIENNPGASGKLLMAMAAHSYSAMLAVWAQRHEQKEGGDEPMDLKGVTL